ncbi:MAG: DNA-protecting protein DprA [Crocinitomicaceae bacterium]|nr:DNA-protecting protein DprA [Crocinitomicaceae bacterium]
MNGNSHHHIALSLLGIGGKKKLRRILNEAGDIETFFKMSKQKMKLIPGVGEKFTINLNRDQALLDAENYLPFIEKSGINSIYTEDANYPSRLLECEDAPLVLYSKGAMKVNQQKTVAIIGTRYATDYGRQICNELIENLKDKNILVVSGLAYGIDIYAHQKCLENNLQTIAVLGHGLDRLYPSLHRPIAEKMLLNGGLITEFLPGTKPDRENFPMRNRIVAGMCDATIVIESGEKGGSLITAEMASGYARDVFAYPGNVFQPFSKGCNELIKKDIARVITCAEDFLKWMNWDNQKPENKQLALFPNLNPIEQSVVDTLKDKSFMHIDPLSLQLKMPIHQLSGLLLQMELSNVIVALPGDNYSVYK